MEKKKLLLHQLLAYESDEKNAAQSIVRETIDTFHKKQHHFDGFTKVYKPIDEDGDKFPPEYGQVVTTVKEKLEYTQKLVIKSLNTLLSKEETNASGTVKADLIVDGENLGTFSATSLLQLEAQLKAIHQYYLAIPTLDPVKKWNYSLNKDLYETETEIKMRTISKIVPVALYEATKEHPAQVKEASQAIQVGQWEQTYQSGKIYPKDKSKLLANIDKLIKAVKTARAEANNAEVINVEIGKKIFDYINKDL